MQHSIPHVVGIKNSEIRYPVVTSEEKLARVLESDVVQRTALPLRKVAKHACSPSRGDQRLPSVTQTCHRNAIKIFCALEAYGLDMDEAVALIPSGTTCPLPWPSFNIIPL
ncbi:hypothetical protein PGTUg99_014065 [Puccinia graminis f. sp. tritici]|uniref:Uncharacterized protein n=1 Tax=Puccinia graminis f. sp. tritici TaxID=56615 RepID=A0A5B0S6I9_PUCGR|nr:hypothetical protein PGTUg99_014065 [Puccinia graminis f. sp. tritici]